MPMHVHGYTLHINLHSSVTEFTDSHTPCNNNKYYNNGEMAVQKNTETRHLKSSLNCV